MTFQEYEALEPPTVYGKISMTLMSLDANLASVNLALIVCRIAIKWRVLLKVWLVRYFCLASYATDKCFTLAPQIQPSVSISAKLKRHANPLPRPSKKLCRMRKVLVAETVDLSCERPSHEVVMRGFLPKETH